MLPNAARNQVFGARWSIMKKLFGTFLTGLVLTACVPALPVEQIEATISARLTAVASPAAPIAELPTATPQPTDIPKPTITPAPTLEATSTPPPNQTPLPEYGARQNPHPFGIPGLLTRGEDKLEFAITIRDVKRGAEKDMYCGLSDCEAPNGMEYIAATVVIDYIGPDKGALVLELDDWTVVTNGHVYGVREVGEAYLFHQTMYDRIKLLSGGTAEGHMAWIVYIDDDAPMLVYGLRDDGSDGVYFSLQ